MRSIAQDGYLVVTWANHHYVDFALTWVSHAQRAGITGYMVGAMDSETLAALARKKVHTFSMAAGAFASFCVFLRVLRFVFLCVLRLAA